MLAWFLLLITMRFSLSWLRFRLIVWWNVDDHRFGLALNFDDGVLFTGSFEYSYLLLGSCLSFRIKLFLCLPLTSLFFALFCWSSLDFNILSYLLAFHSFVHLFARNYSILTFTSSFVDCTYFNFFTLFKNRTFSLFLIIFSKKNWQDQKSKH